MWISFFSQGFAVVLAHNRYFLRKTQLFNVFQSHFVLQFRCFNLYHWGIGNMRSQETQKSVKTRRVMVKRNVFMEKSCELSDAAR